MSARWKAWSVTKLSTPSPRAILPWSTAPATANWAARWRSNKSTSSILTDQRQLARYWQEAQLLASLQHPNILTIYDIVRSKGWLIVELMRTSLQPATQSEGDRSGFSADRAGRLPERASSSCTPRA